MSFLKFYFIDVKSFLLFFLIPFLGMTFISFMLGNIGAILGFLFMTLINMFCEYKKYKNKKDKD